jgi:GNAT superfamily N-acetyltransferase
LLAETVEGGASVGFLAPVQRATAEKYWKGVFEALGSGRMLWVAEEGGSVVGSVQLELCGKENGLHRAEVQKLFVLRSHRGRGIARRLMDELENFARSQGRSLLVLDTLAGSEAETVYPRLGWQRAGQIPKYAADPWGKLFPTVYFYKEI